MTTKIRLKKLLLTFLLLIFALLILFGVYSKLGKENVNVDQLLWYDRSEEFFEAFSDGRFVDTYRQYHPGVTLMYLIRAGQVTYRLINSDNSNFKYITYTNFPLYNFYTKLFVTSFTLVLLLISAYALYKTTRDKFIPILFLIFLLSEPYYLGLLRNLHMDALISATIFCSILVFFAGLKFRSIKYILIAGIISGLGLLTKSVCVSVVLMNVLIALYNFFVDTKNRKWLVKIIGMYLASTILIFFVLFPAMWVAPIKTLDKIVKQGVISTGISGEDNFSHYINGVTTTDPGPIFYLLISKYRISIFSQAILIISIVCVIYMLVKKKLIPISQLFSESKSYQSLLFFSLIYAVGYFIVFTLLGKKTDRYFSPIFPFISLFCVSTLFYLNVLIKKSKLRTILIIFLGILLTSNFVTFALIHPYYFAYYNPFWGGIKKASNELYINQGGIGAYEIAQYINSLGIQSAEMIGATNKSELQVFSKNHIYGLEVSRRKEYKYVILTVQKDRLFKSGRKTIKEINILGSVYLRVVR